MNPVAPGGSRSCPQLEVCLVHQRRAVQRVVAALRGEVTVRDGPKLVVDQRDGTVEPLAIGPVQQRKGIGPECPP